MRSQIRTLTDWWSSQQQSNPICAEPIIIFRKPIVIADLFSADGQAMSVLNRKKHPRPVNSIPLFT